MRKITFLVLSLAFLFSCGNNEKTTSSDSRNVDIKKEKKSVEEVLKEYKKALESMHLNQTDDFFSKDSEIFESGGVEGSHNQYLEHHLRPEFKDFSSFRFTNYFVDVRMAYPYAFTTETYNYSVELGASVQENSQNIELKGVATSVLKKENGAWKIIKRHISSRKRP